MAIGGIDLLKGEPVELWNAETRSEHGEVLRFDSFASALRHAKEDDYIWLIGFDLPTGERIYLQKDVNTTFWIYDPVFTVA